MAISVKQRTYSYFKDENGVEPVKEWLDNLKRQDKFAYSKVTKRIGRAKLGNFGDHKLFDGIGELIIDYGPGYRVYFGIDGDEIIILLNAGTKKRQQADIDLAKLRWKLYQGK